MHSKNKVFWLRISLLLYFFKNPYIRAELSYLLVLLFIQIAGFYVNISILVTTKNREKSLV